MEGANEHLNAMQTDYLIQVRKDSDKKPMLDFEVTMGTGTDSSRPLTTLSVAKHFWLHWWFRIGRFAKSRHSIETLLIDEGRCPIGTMSSGC